MINIDTIDQEILDLEKHDTSYATIERLAWLYTVKDHLQPAKSVLVGDTFGTEFCECCSGVPMESLMQILSDHFEELALIYPKEYATILSKIKALQ